MIKVFCFLAILMLLTACGKKEAPVTDAAAEFSPAAKVSAYAAEVLETTVRKMMAPEKVEPKVQARTKKMDSPTNNRVFMGGPRFTNMTTVTKQNYPDGTYHYADRTEDGFSEIVNRSFVNGEKTEDVQTHITRLLTEECGSNAQTIRIQEAPDKSDGLIPNVCLLVRWFSGQGGDTKECVGIAAVTENFTYLYYFSTYGDYFDSMESTWLDHLDGIKLVDLDSLE